MADYFRYSVSEVKPVQFLDLVACDHVDEDKQWRYTVCAIQE